MRVSPTSLSVRSLLLARDPQFLRRGGASAVLGALRALAQVTLPEPPAGLRAHPLFADRRPPPEAPDPLLLGALAPLRAPERLAGLHELYRELTSSRRETGLYYTPPWLADHVVSRTLRGDEATVIDLSCGAGAFLIAALRRRLVGTADLAGRRRLANAYILGTDTDSEAVEVARAALALVVEEGERTAGDDGVPLPALSFPGLVPGDALRGTDQGFAHAVVGNPPYVDAKTRARLAPEEGAFLRARFPDLRGAFDLFAAFVLRALEVARPGAAVGLVLPDKLLPADYAAPLRRRLLAETTLCEVVDLAEANPFPDAAVFPLFVLLVRAPAGPAHAVRLARWDASRREIPTGEVLQQSLDPVFFAVRPPPVTTRALVPFSARAVVSAGAAGFDGRALCDALVDGDPGGGIPFVVTRSIDRYALLDVPVRFMKRTFATPFLPPGAPLSAARRALFHAPKIVFAGLGKRLEATFVQGPLALGISTYAARFPTGDALAYLAIVNSAWASHVFLEAHGERRLSGGYVTLSARSVASLPVPVLTTEETRALHALAASRLAAQATSAAAAALDAEIDDRIFEIVGVTEAARAAIRARFSARESGGRSTPTRK